MEEVTWEGREGVECTRLPTSRSPACPAARSPAARYPRQLHDGYTSVTRRLPLACSKSPTTSTIVSFDVSVPSIRALPETLSKASSEMDERESTSSAAH